LDHESFVVVLAWNEDLDLSIVQNNWELTILNLNAVTLVEEVAKDGSFSVRVERDRSGLLVVAVGEGKEVLTSGESVEVIVSVSLDLIKSVELGFSLESVEGLDVFVDVRLGVHVGPESFSVHWVLTTTVGLFVTVVDDWNTNGSDSESKRSLEDFVAAGSGQESWVIVVVDEVSDD